MRDIPNDEKHGFVAEKLEHCFAFYLFIRPGQIYHLTTEFERGNLAVEVRRLVCVPRWEERG